MSQHHDDYAHALWRKSSRSNDNGACVELATRPTRLIAVRDSKNPDGPVLRFARAELRSFAERVKGDAG